MSDDEINKCWFKRSGNKWILAGMIFAFLGLAVPFVVMWMSGWETTLERFNELAPVGEYFGGISVGLLTFASVILVTAAIVMQKEELALQRKELEETRHEFKTGNDTAKIQQIDNAFYNMLSLHHQIVNNIKITIIRDTFSGREAISKVKEELENTLAYNQYNEKDENPSVKNWLDRRVKKRYSDEIFNVFDSIDQAELDKAYSDIHKKYGNQIGHYMRNNYRIVKFIVTNVANDKEEKEQILQSTGREPVIGDKRYYFGMLRSQWSNDEFELILINSLFKENQKFKNLIIQHDVLDIRSADSIEERFRLKESMDRFKAYRKLIEV